MKAQAMARYRKEKCEMNKSAREQGKLHNNLHSYSH